MVSHGAARKIRSAALTVSVTHTSSGLRSDHCACGLWVWVWVWACTVQCALCTAYIASYREWHRRSRVVSSGWEAGALAVADGPDTLAGRPGEP